MEHLIDIAELEQRTTIKQATLRKYVVKRKIPFVKIGRLVRFDLPEIEAWIAERKVPVLKGGDTRQEKQESGQFDFQGPPPKLCILVGVLLPIDTDTGYIADRKLAGQVS